MNLPIVFAIFYCGFSLSTGSPCELEKCFFGLSKIISLENEPQLVCGKVIEAGNCFNNCLQDPSVMHLKLKNFQSIITEVCNTELMYDTTKNSECASNYVYELLECFVDYSTSQPLNNAINKKLLKCRQLRDVVNCPKYILKSECGESAAEAVSDILFSLLEEAQQFYCSMFSMEQVGDIKLVHTFPGHSLRKVSKCFDTNINTVAKCLKYVQNPDFIPSINCNAKQDFTHCINFLLGPVCGEEAVTVAVYMLDIVTNIFHIPTCNIENFTFESATTSAINANSENPENSTFESATSSAINANSENPENSTFESATSAINANSENSETVLRAFIKNLTQTRSGDDFDAQSKEPDKEMSTNSKVIIATETPLVSDNNLNIKMAKSQVNSNFDTCAQGHLLILIFAISIIFKTLLCN